MKRALKTAGYTLAVILVLYSGVAIGFGVFSPYSYNRRPSNFLYSGMTVYLQPAMEVLADSKITHTWDWRDINESEISTSIRPLSVGSNESTVRDFSSPWIFWMSAGADIGLVREAAIIKPKIYTGDWALIFCAHESDTTICQEGSIYAPGRQKILVDGNASLYGKTDTGVIIELELESYIDRSERKDILFV